MPARGGRVALPVQLRSNRLQRHPLASHCFHRRPQIGVGFDRAPRRSACGPWRWPRRVRLRHCGNSAPSFQPRVLYAARAPFMRSLMAFASASATAARICNVRGFAAGLSHATNSVPAFSTRFTSQAGFVGPSSSFSSGPSRPMTILSGRSHHGQRQSLSPLSSASVASESGLNTESLRGRMDASYAGSLPRAIVSSAASSPENESRAVQEERTSARAI